MPDTTLPERVAVLENTNVRIESYMQRGQELRVENTRILTEVNATLKNVNAYMEKCDEDRESQAKRLSSLETSRKIQKGILASYVLALPGMAWLIDFVWNIGKAAPK